VSAVRDEALRVGLDGIQADMAEHQRMTGREVTGEANRQLAADTFGQVEGLITVHSDAEPSPAPAAPAPEIADTRAVTVVTARSGHEYTQLREPDATAPARAVAMTHRERHAVVKAMRRLHLLLLCPDSGPLGQPSWRDRALAVMALNADPVRFAAELDALLEASVRTFGDWRVDEAQRLVVSG
jgi:hypothetical protein